MMSEENDAGAEDAPPPAYESIHFAADADALPEVPRDGYVKTKTIEVSVTNPTKVGDGLTAYAVYTVSTKNKDPAYKKDESIVVRRAPSRRMARKLEMQSQDSNTSLQYHTNTF